MKTGNGFRTTGIMNTEQTIEPFLVFGEFYMDRPIFGAHPHAGMSVMTYVLPDSEGSFLNRDSQGDHSIIKPGGVHVTQAGNGIHHDELPAVNGIACHAFQIWINHADKDRWVEPKAFRTSPEEVPEWKTENILLRVIQGSYKNLKSPMELVTKTTLYDVTLKPDTAIEFEAEEMAFIYIVSGKISFAGQTAESNGSIVFEKEGNKVIVKTKEHSANFMFASAVPHNEPIVYGGPFVMTTQQQMQETQERLRKGEMGVLKDL